MEESSSLRMWYARWIRHDLKAISPLRWLLLLWIVAVYLWAVYWGALVSDQVASDAVFIFSLLMLAHFGLYAVSGFLSVRSHRARLLYIAGQAILIVLIVLTAHRFSVALALYLALLAELVSMLHETRLALLVGVSCLLLFGINLALLYGWQSVSLAPRFAVSLHMALLYVLPLFLLVGGYALRQARARARTQTLLDELEQAYKQLADDAVCIESLTRAAERQRMARELHDTLAQGLAGLILQLEAVKSHLVNHHEMRALEIVTQAMGRARTSLATARCAIDDLRAETLPAVDVRQVIEEEIARFTAATGIPCGAEISTLPLIPESLGDSLVRIVAEGLLNVARHAQASQVWVAVAENGQRLEVEIRDNGIGFDPAAATQLGHYGLLGLRERARLLGGQLDIHSAPGQGTTLRLLLPATSRGSAA